MPSIRPRIDQVVNSWFMSLMSIKLAPSAEVILNRSSLERVDGGDRDDHKAHDNSRSLIYDATNCCSGE